MKIMFKSTLTLIVVILSTLILNTTSATTQSISDKYNPLIQLYIKGENGDAASAEKSLNGFQKLSKANPKDPISLAYLGSLYAIQGREATKPFEKLSLTRKGMKLLGRSLDLLLPEHDKVLLNDLPISLHVKSIVGVTFTEAPDLFHRFDQGRDVLTGLVDSGLLASSPPSYQAYIYFYCGKADEKALNMDLAKQRYSHILSQKYDGEYTDLARKRLTNLNKSSD